MRFLEDYYAYYAQRSSQKGTESEKTAAVYAVVNCGFLEAGINREAVRVIGSFSRSTRNLFRFGVMIGGGGMLYGAKDAPFMRKTMTELNNAFKRIAQDIRLNDAQVASDAPAPADIEITMNTPRWLYNFMGNRGWFALARKNGLKRKDLYRKPYA